MPNVKPEIEKMSASPIIKNMSFTASPLIGETAKKDKTLIRLGIILGIFVIIMTIAGYYNFDKKASINSEIASSTPDIASSTPIIASTDEQDLALGKMSRKVLETVYCKNITIVNKNGLIIGNEQVANLDQLETVIHNLKASQ